MQIIDTRSELVNTPGIDKVSDAQIRTWSVVIGESFRRGGVKDGLDAFQSMLQSGNARDPYAFAVTIRELGKLGEIEAAEESFLLMSDLGVKCTPLSIDAMISAYSVNNNTTKSLQILEDALSARFGQVQPIFQSYQAIARGFAKSNNLLGVMYMYSLIQQNDGLLMTASDRDSPDYKVFSLNRDEKISTIWEYLLQVLCNSDNVSLNQSRSLVLSLARVIQRNSKSSDNDDDVVATKKKDSDSHLRQLLLDCIRLVYSLPTDDEEEQAAASRRQKKHHTAKRSSSSSITTNTLLEKCTEFCKIDSNKLSQQSVKSVSDFCSSSIHVAKLSPGIFSHLIARMTREYRQLQEDSKEAQALANEIEKLVNELSYVYQTKPDRLCYENLISVLLRQGRFSDARDTMTKMVLRRYMRPDVGTWLMFVEAYSSRGMHLEALACIDEMISHNIRVTAAIWEPVVSCVSKSGNKKLVDLVDRLMKKTVNK